MAGPGCIPNALSTDSRSPHLHRWRAAQRLTARAGAALSSMVSAEDLHPAAGPVTLMLLPRRRPQVGWCGEESQSLGKGTEVWPGPKSCFPQLSCQFTNCLLGVACQEDECCFIDSLAKELVQSGSCYTETLGRLKPRVQVQPSLHSCLVIQTHTANWSPCHGLG